MPWNGIRTGFGRITQAVTCGTTRIDEPPSRSIAEVSRSPKINIDHKPKVNINLLPNGDGAVISVIPPERPQDSQIADSHVPVDIVLVIDVSGSMNTAAPAPMEAATADGVREDFNLSVLDLTKHAARTIMETLNEGDRLSIVTFSHVSTVLQPLTPMTPENKLSTEKTINEMKPLTTTNLWAGITSGLKQFDASEADSNRIPALMVLTDGMPNHGTPSRGYLFELRKMAPLPATIHTFGFGYHIDSCLLRGISEAGSGNYSFIPDAGMIGTVFIHAVAHLQTTYATKCTLEIQTPREHKLRTTSGPCVNGTISEDETLQTTSLHNILRLDLGNLQHGQSRDICFEAYDKDDRKTTLGTTVVTATLTYSLTRKTSQTVTSAKPLLPHHPTFMAEPMIRYHRSRAMICKFLGSFMTLSQPDGYLKISSHKHDTRKGHQGRLTYLLEVIPARERVMADNGKGVTFTDDELKRYNKLLSSLVLDLEGQVSIALSQEDYYKKWALPYFASLSHAHSRQLCNTFKDPGIQHYNKNSFFHKCRDALDEAFDKIEPPVPSRIMPGPRANIRQSNPILNTQTNSSDSGIIWDGRSIYTVPPRHQPATTGYGGSIGAAPPPPYSPGSRENSAPPAYTPGRINMSLYNNASGSCFAGDTMVQLAPEDGQASQPKRIPISELRKGSQVSTPAGPKEVRYIVQSSVKEMSMCRIKSNTAHPHDTNAQEGGFLVTPWHPIRICAAENSTTSTSASPSTHSDSWIFPADAPHDFISPVGVPHTGKVFSVMLEPDASPAAHAILVSGPDDRSAKHSASHTREASTMIWGVTLGHGITELLSTTEGQKEVDARAHEFFGDYAAVEASLSSIISSATVEQYVKEPGVKRKAEGQVLHAEYENAKRSKVGDDSIASGVIAVSGMRRRGGDSGLVCGFHGV